MLRHSSGPHKYITNMKHVPYSNSNVHNTNTNVTIVTNAPVHTAIPVNTTPHLLLKRLTLSPLAPLGGSQSDPAQTRLTPAVPKHERVKAKPPQGVPAAMATAKHGSHITLPPAHGVDNPCTPHVHSLRCPHPYAHNVTPFLWTSQIYNQYEACPLQ